MAHALMQCVAQATSDVPGELTKWLGALCVSPLVPSLSASGRCVVPGLFDPLAEPATNVSSGDSVFPTFQ
jgi:hypothetical protein